MRFLRTPAPPLTLMQWQTGEEVLVIAQPGALKPHRRCGGSVQQSVRHVGMEKCVTMTARGGVQLPQRQQHGGAAPQLSATPSFLQAMFHPCQDANSSPSVGREYCVACVCRPTRQQRSCGCGEGHCEAIAVTRHARAVSHEQFAVIPGIVHWPGPHITAAVAGPPFVRVSSSTSCARAHVQRNPFTPSRCGMRTPCWQPPRSLPQHGCWADTSCCVHTQSMPSSGQHCS